MAFEHYDKCSLLLPMDGADNGTTFTDWSPNPKTVTVAGNAKTVTAQSKYYGSSGYFDGSGDYLEVPNSSAFDLGTGDFTLAAWVYPTNLTGKSFEVCSYGVAATSGFYFGCNSTAFSFGVTTVADRVVSTSTPQLNTWQHVAVSRASGVYRLFINGVLQPTSSATSDNLDSSTVFRVANNQAESNQAQGYIQDLLVIKGAALWTSDFEPPARLIGTLSGTIRDKDNAPASRIVTAFPRTVPTKIYQTTSSAVDGTFSLRLPATESTALVMANESVMRNDIVDRIIPE